jgi:hypothetical protein
MKTLYQENRIKDVILEKNHQKPKDTSFSLSLGDHWLNGMEWLLRTITMPLHLFESRTTIEARKQSLKDVENKGPLDIDFTVLRTNWYWRHQKRIYRMAASGIIRIRPVETMKCDMMPYATITKLIRTGDKYLVLLFSEESNHHPEYLESSDADEIINIILDRCGEKKPVVERK